MDRRFRQAEHRQQPNFLGAQAPPGGKDFIACVQVVATVEAIGQSGEFHPITVCGRDDSLRAELESRGFGTVIGWTDEMPALMAASDALVENAGGLTCMEAFAVGLPVITFRPIAGHGKDNAETMSKAGVNCYARDEDELHTILRSVTVPGEERDRLVNTARQLFVDDPANDVVELASVEKLTDQAVLAEADDVE